MPKNKNKKQVDGQGNFSSGLGVWVIAKRQRWHLDERFSVCRNAESEAVQ